MSRALKRNFQQMSDESQYYRDPSSPCSPHSISSLTSHDTKKIRHESNSNADESVCMTSDRHSQTHFTPSSSSANYMENFMEMHVPATKTVPSIAVEDNAMANLIFSEPKKKEKKYTAAEVQRFIQEAVAQREAELKEEYNNTLQQLLQQQFESFQNYQQQYVSRHLSKQNSAYIS